MIVALLIVGAALLLLPGIASRVCAVVAPADSARAIGASLLLGAVAWQTALLLEAAPTVLGAAGLESLAPACARIVGHLAPGGPAAGWAAAVVLIVLTARGAFAARRARRRARALEIEPWFGRHQRIGSIELVVVATDRPIALAVPGTRQVLMSEGLTKRLDRAQLDAVIGHETAHQELGHARYVTMAASLDHVLGRFPGLRRSTDALRDALERWADAHAVADGGADRAALHGALAEVASAHIDQCAPATPASTPALLRERAQAIWRGVAPTGPVSQQLLLWAPVAALVVIGLGLVTAWFTDAHHALALGAFCRD